MVRGRRKPSGAAGLANIPKDELAVISAADAAGSAMLFSVAASYQTRAWVWLKARAPLGRHQWPAFANRLVECQSTCPRGRHGERRSWNAASNLSAEPRWIRFDCHDPGHKSILKVSNFAQTPDAQRRKVILNRYAIAKRSVFNSTS
jgi:hypothetical protein